MPPDSSGTPWHLAMYTLCLGSFLYFLREWIVLEEKVHVLGTQVLDVPFWSFAVWIPGNSLLCVKVYEGVFLFITSAGSLQSSSS